MTLITQHFDSLATDLMRLNYMVHEIAEGLEEQTRLLRLRSLGLPDALVNESRSLSDALDQLTEQLEQDHIELAQLRALAHTAALINSTLDLNEVLSRAMDTVIGLTDAERGYILLRNEATGEMEFMIGRKIGRESIEEGEFIVSRSIIDHVIETGDPVVTTNAQEDERFSAQESVMSYALRSILCVPLIYRGEVNGVVYADNRVRQALFGERELQLLVAFANQASIAIQNAQLYERVRARLAEVTEKQQLLDSIFASIASGVITTDRDAYVQTYSPVAETILTVPAEHSLGFPLTSVLPAVYEGFEEVLRNVQEEDSQETIELNTVLDQRGPTNLSFKLSPLKSEEESTMGVAMVVDDLTEIKQRDETLNVIRTYLSAEMVRNIQSIDSLGLGGEERIITSLFADVRGFTTFSERLEPELLMEIINKYLTTSSDAIQLMGGIIDKYMGDAVVGLFNTQLNPLEDHALRAVRAAYAMTQDVEGLHEILPADHRLWLGIGVHTGPAMLGNVGSPSRKEFTVLGEAMTYSKKLQEIAEPGEVILSAETYAAVAAYFEVEETERKLRGEGGIVTAYKILGGKI
ncbi:MAG: GAF domain-containing protein [Chloroflexi bacterium]|nr:GAF domain-containing protein [Chloroflexota bacterium]